LLVVGLILVLLTVAVQGMATSVTVPAGAADQLTAPSTSVGSASLSVSWSGAPSGTSVFLTSSSPTGCSPSNTVATGSGSSGSMSATLSSGTTYFLFACSAGTPATVTFSYTATGISLLGIIGIVIEVIGMLVLLLGITAKPKNSYVAPPEPEAPEDPPPA
jgi:hypothetical protein